MVSAYGKSVQGTMSAIQRESEPEERRFDASLYARSLYMSPAPFLMQLDAMATAKANEKLRVEAQVGLGLRRKGEDFVSVASGSNATVVRRLMAYGKVVETETATHSVAVGRDFLPAGLLIDDHSSLLRSLNRRNITDYPTQLRYELVTERVQLIPYLFLPSWEEKTANREAGGGLRAEYGLSDSNSLGVTALYGSSPAIGRFSASAFARLSPGHSTGLIAEYIYTRRTLFSQGNEGFDQGVAYAKPYYAPWDWLEAGLVLEHASQGAPFGQNNLRLGPSFNARITHWVSLIGDARFTSASGAESDAIYYAQVFIHL
jgi:hypothetical protein